MKIGILYIATGRYINFFREFYETSEKYFLKEYQKTYFVFTDNTSFDYSNKENVVYVEQKHMGWPYDTLMRFDMFLRIEDKLKSFDYIFFFNANMLFTKPIEPCEIIPKADDNDNLVVGLHPSFIKKHPDEFSYDRNKESTAYIPFGQGRFYAQGCLFGGGREEYLKLCKICNENIKKDIEKNVIALWHDESQLNKYLLDKNPLLLGKEYLFPEDSNFLFKTFKAKIIQRNKGKLKYGGHAYLRGETDKKITPLKYWLNKIFKLKK